MSRETERHDEAHATERNEATRDRGQATVADTSAVETALANALQAAVAAGRFDVVAQLSRELEARRLASASNVVPMRRRTS